MFRNNSLKIDQLINSNLQELLKEVNINIDVDENLSDTQKTAFELFKNGQNLVVLGSAGTGKSALIKTMEEYIKTNKKDSNIYLCSTTGISAYNIGGMTIHSFMGIGTGDLPIEALIRRVNRKKQYRDRIITTDILVIDEVSMLSAELFEKLNIICQAIRKSKQFFGGIQIILTGDLNQICPVFNRNMEFTKGEEQDTRLIIESPEFTKEFNKKNGNVIILKENFRQKNDPIFINLLLRIREGKHTEEDITILNSRKISTLTDDDNIDINSIVHLVSSNKKAQLINELQLDKLKTQKVKYISTYTSSGKDKDVKELLIKELQFQFNQKGINALVLKKGCRVMLIKNLDVSRGLVNGALGTIKSFVQDQSTGQQIPVVLFDNSEEEIIPGVSWELEIDNCKGIASQIPLMLAYSVTIHKSQSLTLDSAVLDLDDCWCDAQVYVALSRLRSLDGLYLRSFNPAKIKVNKKMTDYLNNL
jgi:ATP-dependent DNA helicase PIF1